MERYTNKSLVIKLGGQCNLKCKHCHCLRTNYIFNPKIIGYIQNNGYKQITFCGGEPTMYFETIKQIVEKLGVNYIYKLVTNSTLLTNEMVDFFNQYNFYVGMSFDGNNHSRDNSFLGRYRKIAKIKNNGIAVLYSNDNKEIDKLDNDVYWLRQDWNIGNSDNYWLNFCHQTNIAPNSEITKELAQEYCRFIAIKLEFEFKDYIQKDRVLTKDMPIIVNSFKKWIRHKNERGISCCRENNHALTISGDFLLCPYGDITVGDIYTGIDWNKVESYIPERCKNCPQWESCMNTCIANITENECYISKVMYKHFYKLMAKYNVTYEELDEKIRF